MLIAVLVLGLLGSLGILVIARSADREPRPDDVAIRVNGVEVTFAELELRRRAIDAGQSVTERFRAGEDFGMPPEVVKQQRLFADLFAPFEPRADDQTAFVADVIANAAALATARERGLDPTDAELESQTLTVALLRQQLLSSDIPETGLARATFEAQIDALGDEMDAYLRLLARDGIARNALAHDLDLAPTELGVMPLILAMEAADDAQIEIHPSLGVDVADVRAFLEAQSRSMRALLTVQGAMLPAPGLADD